MEEVSAASEDSEAADMKVRSTQCFWIRKPA